MGWRPAAFVSRGTKMGCEMELELNPPLPDKPSEILREALADFDIIAQTPGYAIEMGWWLTPASRSGGLCEVCLAGAVMARRYGADEYLSSADFAPVVDRKFLFLNAIRQGLFRTALAYLHADSADLPITREIPEYDYDPAGWRKRMDEFVDLLQEAGL